MRYRVQHARDVRILADFAVRRWIPLHCHIKALRVPGFLNVNQHYMYYYLIQQHDVLVVNSFHL